MADFKEFKEHGLRAGLGTALCYMLPSESKYHVLCPVESLPAVFGTPEDITYSTTTNKNISHVKGKNTTENIEISLPYNIDYINVMNKIKDVNCKYAYIDLDDFTGQEFVGEASYHMAEVGTDAIKSIILNISVSEANEVITKDLYDLFMDTITFESSLPTVVKLNLATKTSVSYPIVVDPSTAVIASPITSSDSIVTATYTEGKLTLTGIAKGSATVTINATADGLAANSREIKVIVE